MNNKWKVAFLILLGINLVVLIVICSLALVSPKNYENSQLKEPLSDFVSFHVKSNKDDLNQLINHYLQEQAAGSPINYRLVLGDEVELYGILPVLSDNLNMKISFEPIALKNGDLVLKQKKISLGRLNLPISFVLSVISESFRVPQGVEIRPNDKLVYIHMQDIKLKSDMKIKVDQIDLPKDKIGFSILVPVK
ncbi:YpmS family protein [Bacillus sp. BRMEA1]|uniref:YpmS family protein n=1 Tax=Neobacillus endophyticus TaxID=2738405 RepID=UPI001565866E|nr:YpmS family protein [Neobacillus endophyticus]NRD80465.1 YpmS family protein [Neobacillus endophyticus]